MKTPVDLLIATRALFEKNGWGPRDHRCILYTVERAFDKAKIPVGQWQAIAVPALRELAIVAGHPSAVLWNLDPATTQESVLRVIDETIDKLRTEMDTVQ